MRKPFLTRKLVRRNGAPVLLAEVQSP